MISVNLLGGILNEVGNAIVVAVGTLLYQLWRAGASVVNLIEALFRKLAGLDTATGDLTTLIINNDAVKQIFTNLCVFAVVMLIFFTIIQIIREQYKDKNGGNPYILVFRLVKAMVMFMIITAACLVGLQLSTVVLKALDSATGYKPDGGIGGTIFSAMAYQGNIVYLGEHSDDGDITSGNSSTYAALIKTSTSKQWTWTEIPTFYYKNPDNDENAEMLDTYIDSSTGHLFISGYDENGNTVGSDKVYVINNNGKALKVKGTYLMVLTSGGNYPLEGVEERYNYSIRFTDDVDGTVNYLRIAEGKPSLKALRAFGEQTTTYYYVNNDKSTTLYSYFLANSGLFSRDYPGYMLWINDQMKSKGKETGSDTDELLIINKYYKNFWGNYKSKEIGAFSYTNWSAVWEFYNVGKFNWIIGFGALFIALGVYNSFAFGMIQRIAELGVLYMFSPVTLAFYPFDDGAQFNNSFVKPFYKKAIASFAPVLSLNLFFVILPAFDTITWFPSALFNFLASCLVSIALLSMLPKVRSTIQTMLGADPMEDKKMFGKGSVTANAWEKTKKYALKPAAAYKKQKALREGLNFQKTRKALGYGKSLFQKDGQARKDLAQLKKDGVKGTFEKKKEAYQLKKDTRKANDKDILDQADNAAKKKGQTKDQARIEAINNNKALKDKYLQQYGKLMGMNQKDIDDMKKGGFGSKHYDKLKEAGKIKSRRELLQEQLDKEALENVENDENLKGKAVETLKTDAELQAQMLKKLNTDENFRNKFIKQTGFVNHKDKDKNFEQKHLEQFFKDTNLSGKQKTAEEIKARDNLLFEMGKDNNLLKTLDKQGIVKRKKADNEAIKNAKQREYDLKEYDKIVESGKLRKKDADGTERDWTKEEYLEALENDNSLRKRLGIHKVKKEESDTILGKAKKVGKTITAPLSRSADFVKSVAKSSAFVDTIFDRDNGLFFQTDVGKMIDEFSYFKTFKGLDKLEEAKTARIKQEAFAQARTLRYTNAFSDNMSELADMDEALAYRKAIGDDDQGKKNMAIKKKAKQEAEKAIFDVYDEKAGMNEAGKRVMKAMLDSFIGGAIGEERKSRETQFYNLLNTGSDANIKKLLKEDEAREVLKIREAIKNEPDQVSSKRIEDHRTAINDYTRAAGMVYKDGDESTWKSTADFEDKQNQRKKKIDEYMDVGERMLGISKKDREYLIKVRSELTAEGSDYNLVKKAYEAAFKEGGRTYATLKDGSTIYIDGKAGFNKFQNEVFSDYEKAVKAKVNVHKVAFRDYVEKTGDRMDGILGATMAQEQVKLMQETVRTSSKETHQLFRTDYFVNAMKESRFQELGEQFLKASRGEVNELDKDMLAAIADKNELKRFGDMFMNMYGDAEGEMRGGGFATANNIIARTFRVAFVDQINDALKATASLIDSQQINALNRRDELIHMLDGDLIDPQFKHLMTELQYKNIGDSSISPRTIETNFNKTLEKIDEAIADPNLDGAKMQELRRFRERVQSLLTAEMNNRYYRRETNEITYRMRELTELDYQLRDAGARSGDKLQ